MKKLKLNGVGDMLTKDQMKQITGGLYGTTGCNLYCASNYDCMTYSSCLICNYVYTGNGYSRVCTNH